MPSHEKSKIIKSTHDHWHLIPRYSHFFFRCKHTVCGRNSGIFYSDGDILPYCMQGEGMDTAKTTSKLTNSKTLLLKKVRPQYNLEVFNR